MSTEQRVDKLEYDVTELKNDVKELKKDVAGLKIDVATIKERLMHVVTHADLAKLMMWMLGLSVASLISIIVGVLNYLK